jgi:zinc transporter ZupT
VVDGVPGERTAPARQRTGWTATATAALTLHAAPTGAGAGAVLLTAGVVCAAVLVTAVLVGVLAAVAVLSP